ncbi:DUF2628 domain-containing protein [Agrobacterium tumefaciens]|uniref:DUF2628 domain-containing protein n=1 Tax=Agrobacterium tumefaciens TaxID=358 RepID=A0A176WVG1_AGRTU|nr:DUF2628 domain-containing protein [Agrobacterium tumefaciens]OAE36966.1 hypothetical protein A7J57_12015 [Agrobacterium tumefaciens]
MTSYLVLEAPNGPDRDHKTTRFIADRFVWLAFFAPWLWLAINRLWLATAIVVIAFFAAGQISTFAGFEPAGILFGLATGLITALEGRDFLVRHLIRKGWTLTSVVSAPDLSSAEDIYFSGLSENADAVEQMSQPVWTPSPQKSGDTNFVNDPAGSFLFDLNGRR